MTGPHSDPKLAAWTLLALLPGIAAAQPPQWLPSGVNAGGALFAPSYSPHDTTDVYLSCDVAGMFHSHDSGAHWKVLDQRTIIGNRQSQVRFTNDPLVQYSLDYSNFGSAPSKSTDGGVTWHVLDADPTGLGAFCTWADPASANRVIVADYSNVFVSLDGGASFDLRFSTSDGAGVYISGVFFDGNDVYLGTNLGILASHDGGATDFAAMSLTGIPSSEAIINFAAAKTGGVTRFLVITANSGDVWSGLNYEEVHYSYTGIYSLQLPGTAWTASTSGIAAPAQPIFVSMVGTNNSTAFIAGGSTNGVPVVYKGTYSGGNWSWASVLNTGTTQNVQTGYAGNGGDFGWTWGETAMGFAVSPVDINRMMLTDYGFAHESTDGGATWHALYVPPSERNPAGTTTPKGHSYHNTGLEVTAVWSLCWSDATHLFAGITDIRGARSTDGGQSWNFAYTGHSDNTMYKCLKHPASGKLYAATSSIHDMYQSTYVTDARIDGGSGRVLVSSDQGATWTTLHDFGHPVIWVAADPTNANRLYASVIHSTQGGIFRTDDLQDGASSAWVRTTVPTRTQGHPLTVEVLNDGSVVCSYSARRAGSPLSFQPSSGVFYSTNQGTTWADRTDANMRYWTKDLVIDPHDASQNTWYAGVFSGYGGDTAGNNKGGLFRTTDRGQHWTRLTDIMDVESCTISPDDSNVLYMTTQYDGLWYCSNLQSASPVFAPLPAYDFAHSMRVFFNPNDHSEIWVTSFGNGMRVGHLATTSLVTGWSIY